MGIEELTNKIALARGVYNRNIGRRDSAQEKLTALSSDKDQRESDGLMFREELAVVLSAGAKQLEVASQILSTSASYAITKVFGDDYIGLKIEPDATGTNTIAKVVLYKMHEGEVMPADPFEDNGGGVCDVLSGILKFSALNVYDPPIENAFITDEMSKHVSEEYREAFALVLRELSIQYGRQVIFSTHDTALAISSDNLITF